MSDRISLGSSGMKDYIIRCDNQKGYKEAKRVLKRIGGIINDEFPTIRAMFVSIDTKDLSEIMKYRPREPAELTVPNIHL